MFDLHAVPLPAYSRTEDTVNSITHLLGVPLGIAALVLGTHKLRLVNASAGDYFSLWIYGCSLLLLFGGSALYHGLRPGFAKQIARVQDHANIFILIAGTLSAFYLIGIKPINRPFAVGCTVFSWTVAAAGILMTYMDQEKFKKIQLAMYVLLGWSGVVGMVLLWKNNGKAFVTYATIGGIAETVGAVCYVIGKKYRYVHAVFHVFVLAGCTMQFIGSYRCLF